MSGVTLRRNSQVGFQDSAAELESKPRQEFFILSSKLIDIQKFFLHLSAQDQHRYGLRDNPLLEKTKAQRSSDCFDIVGALYGHYKTPNHSHECPNYTKLEQVFNDIFFTEAQWAMNEGHYSKAADALSKVDGTLQESTFVEQLVNVCLDRSDIASAVKCLSKVNFPDKWKMELHVGLMILEQNEMTPELMRVLLTLAEKIYPHDQDSSLAKGIIDRCFKEKKYYQIAVEAVGWFCCRESVSYAQEQIKELMEIAKACLEIQDIEVAYEAYSKMYYKHPLPPAFQDLQQKIVDGLIEKGAYDKAFVITNRMSNVSDESQALLARGFFNSGNFEAALEIIKKMPRAVVKSRCRDIAEVLFYDFKKAIRYEDALSVAPFINDDEDVRHALRYLSWDVRGHAQLSKRALGLALHINL